MVDIEAARPAKADATKTAKAKKVKLETWEIEKVMKLPPVDRDSPIVSVMEFSRNFQIFST